MLVILTAPAAVSLGPDVVDGTVVVRAVRSVDGTHCGSSIDEPGTLTAAEKFHYSTPRVPAAHTSYLSRSAAAS